MVTEGVRVEEAEFEDIKKHLDILVDFLPDGNLHFRMGFGLAGEFLKRGLLETRQVDMKYGNWEMKFYRGRHVIPDPDMPDYNVTTAQPLRR